MPVCEWTGCRVLTVVVGGSVVGVIVVGVAVVTAPCMYPTNQVGVIARYAVAMEYAMGKISARGREILWLNHPCYLGYKGEGRYKQWIILPSAQTLGRYVTRHEIPG